MTLKSLNIIPVVTFLILMTAIQCKSSSPKERSNVTDTKTDMDHHFANDEKNRNILNNVLSVNSRAIGITGIVQNETQTIILLKAVTEKTTIEKLKISSPADITLTQADKTWICKKIIGKDTLLIKGSFVEWKFVFEKDIDVKAPFDLKEAGDCQIDCLNFNQVQFTDKKPDTPE